ncbi:SDR family NAD(P)-dependent oxidoreductase [Corallococcus macrosporus]|uniref:Oxidoreductase n=1 Tax=Corallococcus macrosporus DSM 14697 TaxID=1189310 RepID=A0A250K4H1_9BACT|nr:SDR family oxidoreductase [Corallococcus macrosporus]ATB50913.1 oxidoreductase [Corallococcus macrosporus DSM 14697]
MNEVGTRKVLVTGGGTGIGRAVAEALLRAGGQVVVSGRRAEVLESLMAAWPGQAFALPCDLASPEAREGLLRRAATMLGGLDGFVHSAGQVVHQLPGHIGEDALRAQLEINLVAPLRLGEQALEVLAPGGAQVFIASTLATRPVVTSAVYSAAKAGLLQVMKVLALAGAAKGVRASAVLPGVVETDMVREVRLAPGEGALPGPEHARRQEAQLAGLRALHPLGRLGRPEDVAGAVRYLLGASWLSGSELVLDGGLLLRE